MASFPPYCTKAPLGPTWSKFTTEHLISHEQPVLNSQRFLEFLQEIIHRTSIFDIQIHFQGPEFQASIKPHDLTPATPQERTFLASPGYPVGGTVGSTGAWVPLGAQASTSMPAEYWPRVLPKGSSERRGFKQTGGTGTFIHILHRPHLRGNRPSRDCAMEEPAAYRTESWCWRLRSEDPAALQSQPDAFKVQHRQRVQPKPQAPARKAP